MELADGPSDDRERPDPLRSIAVTALAAALLAAACGGEPSVRAASPAPAAVDGAALPGLLHPSPVAPGGVLREVAPAPTAAHPHLHPDPEPVGGREATSGGPPAPWAGSHPDPEPEGGREGGREATVFCAEGLAVLAGFASGSDDGCRPEVCEHGRGADGHCLAPEYEVVGPGAERPDRVLVEPSVDPDEHPCERQRDSDDGLLGICTAGGIRYCFDGGWSVCPGGSQPCPSLPEGDPLAFAGRGWPSPGSPPTVPFTAGRWRAEVCLADSPYGRSGFTVALLDSEGWPVARTGGDWTFALVWVRGPADGEPGVADGWWSVDFDVLPAALGRPAQLHVTAEAGGAWTAAFTRLSDSAGSR